MTDGKSTIREALADAKELGATPDEKKDAPKLAGILPPDFPIIPLGVDSDYLYMIDGCNHFQAIEDSKLGRIKIIKICGTRERPGSNYLWDTFPRFGKGSSNVPVGWDIAAVSERIIDACNMAGSFSPANRVRGAGIWRDEHNQAVVHCGDKLYIGAGSAPIKPGLHDGIVYPARDPLPSPLFDDNATAGQEAMYVLSTWNFLRGEIDVKLILASIGAGFLGAYPIWRPALWLTGDTQTGKSLLQEFLENIYGAWQLRCADATSAGLFQTLHYDCLPVALDEFEPEVDYTKSQAILNLAKLAASGAAIVRGGQTGKPVQFSARSGFFFSSVLIPSMKPEHKNRMAICELGPVKAIKPIGDMRRFRTVGRKILGRILQQIVRYDDTFEAYRSALVAMGHKHRTGQQFGALGAAFDLIMHDSFDPISAQAWAAMLPPRGLVEVQEGESDAQKCLDRLTSYKPELYRAGAKASLATWMRTAQQALMDGTKPTADCDAFNALAMCGMRIQADARTQTERPKDRAYWVAISNNHQGTADIFSGTHWQLAPGGTGVWIQALRRLPGAQPGHVWIDGRDYRCTLLPFETVFCDAPKADEFTEPDHAAPYGEPLEAYEPGERG